MEASGGRALHAPHLNQPGRETAGRPAVEQVKEQDPRAGLSDREASLVVTISHPVVSSTSAEAQRCHLEPGGHISGRHDQSHPLWAQCKMSVLFRRPEGRGTGFLFSCGIPPTCLSAFVCFLGSASLGPVEAQGKHRLLQGHGPHPGPTLPHLHLGPCCGWWWQSLLEGCAEHLSWRRGPHESRGSRPWHVLLGSARRHSKITSGMSGQ